MLAQRFLQILLLLMTFSASAFSLAADDKVSNKANLDGQGRPRTDVIPSDNSDLEDVLAKATAISVFAARCQGMECPILDCEAAAFFQDNLYKTEDYLKHLLRWLEKASKAHFDHFMSVRAQSTLSGERLAELQEILAWQEYVMGIANSMLDIADIADIFETYAKDPSKLNPENFEELVNHAWRLDKLIKKVESGSTTIAGGLSGQSVPAPYAGLTPDGLGLSGSDWNALKGYTGEVLGMVHETRKGLKAGESLFDAFNKPGGARANLLSAIGSAVSAWGKSDVAARAARAQQLALDLAAEDSAAAHAYNARRKVLLRIEKAENALAAVQAANTALQACMVKAQCPLRSRTRPGNNLPDFIQIGPNGEQIESWGWALSRIQIELDDVRNRLGPPHPDLRDHCPSEEEQNDSALHLGDSFPGSGVHILIGFDSPQWCTYQDGNPTPVGLTPPPQGGDDPRDAPPPDDGGGGQPEAGDDPRDAGKQPCSLELTIINTFLRQHEDELRAEINDRSRPQDERAQKIEDLNKIKDRKKYLESDCPEDGDDPRDTPSDDGDPRDVAVPAPQGQSDPCEELRDLRAKATQLGRDISNFATSAARRAEARSQLEELIGRIEELQKDCPEEAGDPADVQTPPTEPPRGVPVITIYVKAKSSVAEGQTQVGAGLANHQIKLIAPSTQVALPGPGTEKPQTDHDQEPVQGVTDSKGNLALGVPIEMVPLSLVSANPTAVPGGPAYAVNIDTATQASVNVKMEGAGLGQAMSAIPAPLMAVLEGAQLINGAQFLTFTYPASLDETVQRIITYIPGVVWIEVNFCRDKQAGPTDPMFQGKGAWEQPYDNQWAIKRVGLDDSRDSAWNLLGRKPQPVVVAVIDTGLDWNHLDMDWNNIWENPRETPNNGIDDDNNGYVDDIIGWDFYANNNKPWDHDGHGTFVSGVIAAAHNNGVGIAGVNPHAQIMVLKALNNFGHSRASYLARAIVYAADNGARIINMSVGGKNMTRIEREAIAYARSKDVLIVVASGNEGVDISNFGPAGEEGVIAVGATGLQDEHQPFSNWGHNLDIAAPGIEVLGLRARRTDTMRDIPGVEYVDGANYVGEDKRYYRASGTSFAAPIVTGVASLLLSQRPELTAEQLKRMLLHSATDVQIPGVDQLTGHGMVDAKAALKADPAFYISGSIGGVQVIERGGKAVVQVVGSIAADKLKKAWIELGEGESPKKWTKVSKNLTKAVNEAVLTEIEAVEFGGASVWTIRVIVVHKNGARRESRFVLNLG